MAKPSQQNRSRRHPWRSVAPTCVSAVLFPIVLRFYTFGQMSRVRRVLDQLIVYNQSFSLPFQSPCVQSKPEMTFSSAVCVILIESTRTLNRSIAVFVITAP